MVLRAFPVVTLLGQRQMPGWLKERVMLMLIYYEKKKYYFIEIVRLISSSEQDIAANLWLHPVTLPPLNNESQ